MVDGYCTVVLNPVVSTPLLLFFEADQGYRRLIAHFLKLDLDHSRRFEKLTKSFIAVIARIQVRRYLDQITPNISQISPIVAVTCARDRQTYSNTCF